MDRKNRIEGYQQVQKGWHDFGEGRRYYFKSSWELNIAKYLEWLRLEAYIGNWEYEPETFWFPVKRGTTNYKPDFRVTERDGGRWYIEVKGYLDQRSRTALQRMRKYHPGIELRLFDGPVYHDIIDKWGRLFGVTKG